MKAGIKKSSRIKNARNNVTLPLELPSKSSDLDESSNTQIDADVTEDIDEATRNVSPLPEDVEEVPVSISEKNEQKNMKMESLMNRRIDEYIVGFKNDIKLKMTTLEIINQPNMTETDVEKMREFLEYVFEYPKLILNKKDFNVTKRRSSTLIDTNQENYVLPFPAHMQCLAKRSDGIQCTRKKKKCCNFCGTHAKLDEIHRSSTPESVQRMEVSAEDIHGIIYYIDRYNNVYNTEDILEGKENPRIIAKATKHSNNMYMIEEFL
jgi:hypothetical protein